MSRYFGHDHFRHLRPAHRVRAERVHRIRITSVARLQAARLSRQRAVPRALRSLRRDVQPKELGAGTALRLDRVRRP